MRNGRASGGACPLTRGSRSGCAASQRGVGGATCATIPIVAGTDLSALTKFFRPCVLHSVLLDFSCGQQPCFCVESSSCGHEKQFPQNRAAIISTAIAVVEKVLILLQYT